MDGTNAACPNPDLSGDAQRDASEVTRTEVIDAVESVFRSVAVTRSQLIAAAELIGVRQAVIDLLRRLPDRLYRHPADMWDELPDVPIGI